MKSIRLQMVVFIIVIIFVQFVFLGMVTDNKLNELPGYYNKQYEEIVSARSSEVSRVLIGLLEQVELISKLPFVIQMDFDAVKDYLFDVVNPLKHKNLTISNIDGWAWRTTGMEIDISEQEQFRAIIIEGKDNIISQPFISPYIAEPIPIITVSQAVKNNNETVGLVNVVVDIEFLNDIVRKIDVKQSEQGWIINKQGIVIAHTDSQVPMNKHIEEIIKVDVDLQTILEKKSGIFQHYDESGESLVTIYKEIEASPDWTFMLTFYENVIYSEVNGLRKTFLYALMISVIIVVLPTVLYSNRILRPVLQLKETFEEATHGNLNVKANENIQNELGDASKSFNTMMDKIKTLMFKDPITDLYNYQGFMLEMPEKLGLLRKRNGVVGISILSLDDFKRINSIGGFEAGNELLKQFTSNLASFVNKEEGLARYFGDEFLLLLWAEDIESLEKRLSTIHCCSMVSVMSNNYEFSIKMSIGTSIIDNSNEVEKTIKQATLAKLKVKELGGNAYLFYNEQLDDEIKEKQEIENALSHALDANELYLVYQPIVSLESNQITAMEALLRWKHEKFNGISPLRIIKIAEQTGLILDIGDWVLREACRQNKEWQDQGYSPIVISINISTFQLEEINFIDKVEKVIKDTGLDANLIELEITETNAMFNMENNVRTIKRLKDIGVRVAIDDFGTGYSSLSYIARFSIDTLKIDRSFITQIGAKNHSKTIVDTILSMGKTINVSIIAEGVETAEQLQYLKDRGCDKIQGYYISKPAEPETIKRMLEKKS